MYKMFSELKTTLGKERNFLQQLKKRNENLHDPDFDALTYRVSGMTGMETGRQIADIIQDNEGRSTVRQVSRILDNSIELLRLSMLVVQAQAALSEKNVRHAGQGASVDHKHFSSLLLQTLNYQRGLSDRNLIDDQDRHQLAGLFSEIVFDYREMAGDSHENSYKKTPQIKIMMELAQLRLHCAGATLNILDAGMMRVATRQEQTFVLLKSLNEAIIDETPQIKKMIADNKKATKSDIAYYDSALNKVEAYVRTVAQTVGHDEAENQTRVVGYRVTSRTALPNLGLALKL